MVLPFKKREIYILSKLQASLPKIGEEIIGKYSKIVLVKMGTCRYNWGWYYRVIMGYCESKQAVESLWMDLRNKQEFKALAAAVK